MNRWTDKEREYLKKYYNVIHIKDIEEQLNRSATSIRAQVFYLRRRGWTFNRKKDEQSN